MRKQFIPILSALLLLLGTIPHAQAQTTTHSLVTHIPVGWRVVDEFDGGKSTEIYTIGLINYAFRRNLSETSNSSFSLGPQIGLGVGIYSGYYGYGVMYSGDLQLWGDYNIGMGAVPEPSKNTGWYFGLGAGISYTGADGESIDEYNGISYGPMGRAGIRIGFYSPKKDMQKPVSMGVFYKHGLEAARWRAAGFQIMIDF